jgi:tRNA A22 N-methylase
VSWRANEFESLAAPPAHGPVNVRTFLIVRAWKIGRENVVAEIKKAQNLGEENSACEQRNLE